MKIRLLLILLCWACGTSVAQERTESTEQRLVLKAARLLDVTTGEIKSPGVVVIQGDRIELVNPAAPPVGTRIIDLKDSTLLPGLIDVHEHWDGDLGLTEGEKSTLTPVRRAVRATRTAKQVLLAGFTTVRIMGSIEFIDVAIGQAAEDGLVIAPRVISAGYHLRATASNANDDAYKTGMISGATEGIKAVRYMVENGARWIKVVGTPRGATPIPRADISTFSPDELQAIVAEANRQLVKVAVHAHGPTGAHNAVVAGVHSIEHGSLIREDTLREMKKRGTYLVPTLYVVPSFKEADGVYDFNEMSQEIQEAENNLLSGQMRALPIAHKLGVKIAYGTDLGSIPLEKIANEFEMLMQVGLSETEAIRTATINAADLLDTDDRGRLEPGMLADIIAVPGDPLDDITALGNVSFVMKGGEIFKCQGKSGDIAVANCGISQHNESPTP